MKVLRNKNFAILFSGQMVSKLGNNLYLLALPWYVYTVTGSKTALATTGFLQSLPIILGLFAGVFVDRWNKRLTMVTTDILRVITAVGLYIAVVYHAPLWAVIVLVLVLEAVGKFFGPAAGSLIPLLVPIEDIAGAQGLIQSVGALAQLVAMFGGGVLMQYVGPAYLFLGNAIAYLVSVLTLMLIRYSESLQTTARKSFLHEWLEGLRISFLSRRIVSILLAAMATNFALAAFDITMTAWVKGPMHGTATTLGAIGATFFVGMIVGGIALNQVTKRFSTRTILIAGLGLTGLLTAVFGLRASLWWDLPDGMLMGLFVGLMNGALSVMFVTLVPTHVRGRVFGTLGTMSSIMTPAGIAFYGWLLTWVPLKAELMLIGVPVILSALWLMMPMKDDTSRLMQVDNVTA